MTRTRRALALIAVFALLAVACGDDEPEAPTETQPPATVIDTAAQEAAQAALAEAEAELEAAQAALAEAEASAAEGGEEAQMALEEAQKAAEEAQTGLEEAQKTAEEALKSAEEAQMALEEAAMGPGAGVSVTMARANWSTGYMQAAIYAALLAELGYEVSDPADLELAPSNAYVSMATGEFDFWANSWLPNHDQFLAATMPDGSLVSDHVTRLGREMARSGVQGLITNKAFADQNGVTTLDALLTDPDQFAVYEAADPSPGDGVLQIYGCPEGWGCHVNINSWIENAGWDNVEQFDIGGYEAMIADAISRDENGEPYLVYTWAPSHYVSDLRPGDNAVWVSIHDDPSISPTQIEGPTSIGDRCTTDPCLLGWDAADIAVISNNDFLAANPAAARLFELVTINPVDVALQNVRMQTGENSEDDIKRHAAEWIADNRPTVDVWLAIARVPVDETPGSGVSVTMARANWSTGYMQAAIYAALLAELGYEVSDPADLELAPSNAYVSMATGEFDFWANSWLPNHDQFLAATMPDGSLVSDHVTRLGREMARSGVQGLITNKAFADQNGVTTLDALLTDPDQFAVYEAADPSPGDGVLQIYGCPEGWGCHVNINSWIENAGWDNVEQFDIGGYEAMIADAISRDENGEPYLVYTWAPSHYVSDLRPGDNAVWVSIHDDPSISPTQIEGPTSIGDRCTTDPCLLGWDAADIAVISNNDFLAANPAAARLFELVTINPVDVALQNVRMQTGENSEDDIKRHAAEWIADNRDLADSWLRAARLIG